jgi:hypothetical protein
MTAALAAAASLVLVACAERAGPAAGGGAATITITSPKDGESVASPVDLVVAAQGAEIGAPETGLMHFHVYVDDSSEYAVVTTESEVSVPAGEHTLRVVLAEANHQETATSASVSITVTGGAGGSPSPGGDDYGVGY